MIGPRARLSFGRYPDELDADPPAGSPLEAALGVLPSQQKLPLPRWLGPLAVCCLVGFLPWIIYLALTLPRRARAEHYDLAWIGFDCAMWIVLAALAWTALKRHPAIGPVAAVAATMLVVDAWFDVLTATGDQLLLSLVLAVAGELPLAAICVWVAINAEQIRARAYRRLRSRWEAAIGLAREAAVENPSGDRTSALSPPPAAPRPQ